MFANCLRSWPGYGFVPGVSKVVPGAHFLACPLARTRARFDCTRDRALSLARVLCAALVWVAMPTGSASALDLRWAAPAECSPRDVQRTRIEQLLAREGLAAIALTVSGRVSRAPQQRYRLWLQIVTATHRAERTVQLADCESVDQTTEALVAMAITPAASTTSGRSQRAARPVSAPASPKSPRVRTNASRAMAPGTRAGAARASNTPAPSGPAAASRAPSGASSDPTSSSVSSAPVADLADAQRDETPRTDEEGSRDREAGVERERAAIVERERAAAERAATDQREKEAGDRSESRVTHMDAADLEPARWWARASLLVGAANLGLPNSQLDTGLRLGVARGAGYGELRADGLWPRTEQVDGGGDGRVRIRSSSLGMAGCAAWGGGRVRAGPCARVSLIRSVGEVSRITARRGDQALLWCTATLSALLGVRVYEMLELSMEAGVGLPLSARPRFTVEGRGTAQTARLWSMQAVLGLGLRWEQKRASASRNEPRSPIGR